MRLHPFLDHSGPIPIVHRGGPVGASENTLSAFDRAYSLGFRYFETDVHATSDGVLVAFHDWSLRRLTGERVAIGNLTAEEVAKVRVDGEPIPLLDELLSSFPDVRFNIDPKSDNAVRPLVKEIEERRLLDRICLASFSDHRLRFLRTAFGRRACTAAGPREVVRAWWQVRRGDSLTLDGADVLQVPPGPIRFPLVDRRFVEAAHAVGVPLHVWTVNEAIVAGQLLELGVDGIMSDDAVMLREVFGAHGVWADGA